MFRRWNGWGTPAISYPLHDSAAAYLAGLVGEGCVTPDASMDEILVRLPGSRLANPGKYFPLSLTITDEPLERLLTTLARKQTASSYAAKILAAFPQTFSPAAARRQANEALLSPLTARELDVLALLEKRCTNKEIADTLVISVETVYSHVKRIGDKLGAHGRQAIVQVAKDQGLL